MSILGQLIQKQYRVLCTNVSAIVLLGKNLPAKVTSITWQRQKRGACKILSQKKMENKITHSETSKDRPEFLTKHISR